MDEKTDGRSSLQEERPHIFQPLAREDYKPASKVAPSVTTGSGALPIPGTKAASAIGAAVAATTAATPGTMTSASAGATSGYRGQLDESYARSFPHLERRKAVQPSAQSGGLEPVSCHFGVGLLDGMVVTGIGTILLVCILMITQVNLVGLLTHAQTDGSTRIHIALLFVTVLQLYMLTARSFAGTTLGEWAFDLQLGSDENQKRAVYPLQVAWRALFGTATGIVLLPFLSFVFKRDLQKYLCGLQLFHKP